MATTIPDSGYTKINPNQAGNGTTPLTDAVDTIGTDNNNGYLDSQWSKEAFLISDKALGNVNDISYRYWSSAAAKHTDTRLGCNIGINPKPSFTRYSDIRDKGRLTGRNDVSISNAAGNYGMGRYYSEAIDDPAQTVYLTFGVPQFNSIGNFLSQAFDGSLVTLARSGRADQGWFAVGQAIGAIATFIVYPPFAIAVVAGRVLSSFFPRSSSKFYTLKPTMFTYWSAVNNLVNILAVNRGVFPRILNTQAEQLKGNPVKLDSAYLQTLSSLMPDVFRGNTTFDMHAIANKGQRLANQLAAADWAAADNGAAVPLTGMTIINPSGGSTLKPVTDTGSDMSLQQRLTKILSFSNYDYYRATTASGPDDTTLELDPRIDPTSSDPATPRDPSYFNNYQNDLAAEFQAGSKFAIFKVDHTGSVQESFSNSVVESDLSQRINKTSSESKEARFTFADGNIFGGSLQDVVDAGKAVVSGALSQMSFGFSNILTALSGSAYIDIPKHWQDSSASLPRSSYTMNLVSPYGNSISQMINIDIPLAMILAGALPIATGKQSYTSPFICQLYDRGRCQVQLGMIESVSVSRGITHLPFNLKGNALGIEVTFSIVDLSTIISMPLSGGIINDVDININEDNTLSSYLSVLAGQDINSQINPLTSSYIARAKQIANLGAITSPAYLASLTEDTVTSGVFKFLTLGAFNAIEGLNGGNSATVNN